MRFGTFLYNSEYERSKNLVKSETTSLWSYLNSNPSYIRNIFYQPNENVLFPITKTSYLKLWSGYFFQSQDEYKVLSQHNQIFENVATNYQNYANDLKEQLTTMEDKIEKMKAEIEELRKRKY